MLVTLIHKRRSGMWEILHYDVATLNFILHYTLLTNYSPAAAAVEVVMTTGESEAVHL